MRVLTVRPLFERTDPSKSGQRCKMIRLLVPRGYFDKIDEMRELCGLLTLTDLFNTSYTLFESAITERQSGKWMRSFNERTALITEPTMPSFTHIDICKEHGMSFGGHSMNEDAAHDTMIDEEETIHRNYQELTIYAAQRNFKHIDDLRIKCGKTTQEELLNETLVFLKWAVDECLKESDIYLFDKKTHSFEEVTMPVFENIRTQISAVRRALAVASLAARRTSSENRPES